VVTEELVLLAVHNLIHSAHVQDLVAPDPTPEPAQPEATVEIRRAAGYLGATYGTLSDAVPIVSLASTPAPVLVILAAPAVL
jgi:hypothetical protein